MKVVRQYDPESAGPKTLIHQTVASVFWMRLKVPRHFLQVASFVVKMFGRTLTPPKFKMEPENDGFQKESPFPGTSFQVPC